MQEPSWWCQRHRQCATERCSRRGKRDEQCWQSLDNLGDTPHDRRVGAGQCLSCVEEQFSSSTLDQPKTCAACVSDVERRGALSCSVREWMACMNCCCTARVLRANCLSVFVFCFFPESGLTLCIDVNLALQCGIELIRKKKTCKVVEVMNECTAPAAEVQDRPNQNLLVSFSRSS